eukprot:1762463-Lingulodinium_polyedra.AAC.1
MAPLDLKLHWAVRVYVLSDSQRPVDAILPEVVEVTRDPHIEPLAVWLGSAEEHRRRRRPGPGPGGRGRGGGRGPGAVVGEPQENLQEEALAEGVP